MTPRAYMSIVMIIMIAYGLSGCTFGESVTEHETEQTETVSTEYIPDQPDTSPKLPSTGSTEVSEKLEQEIRERAENTTTTSFSGYTIQKYASGRVEELYILLDAIDKDISLNIPLDDRYDLTYSADSVVHDDVYTELENEKIILTNKKEDRKVTLTGSLISFGSNSLYLKIIDSNYIIIQSSRPESVGVNYLYIPERNKFFNVYSDILMPILGRAAFPAFSVDIQDDMLILDETGYCCDEYYYNEGGTERLEIQLNTLVLSEKKRINPLPEISTLSRQGSITGTGVQIKMTARSGGDISIVHDGKSYVVLNTEFTDTHYMRGELILEGGDIFFSGTTFISSGDTSQEYIYLENLGMFSYH